MYIALFLSLVIFCCGDKVPLVSSTPVLGGIDVVAFHVVPHLTSPIMGKSLIAYNFSGFQFWFSKEQYMHLFSQDPWRYAPAYGGFAANAVENEKPPTYNWTRSYMGPAVTFSSYKIYKGRLYFAQSDTVTHDLFATRADNNIEKADARWLEWWGGPYTGPFNTHCFVDNSDLCLTNGNDYSRHFDNLDTSLLDPGYFKEPDFSGEPQLSDALKHEGLILIVSAIVAGSIFLCFMPGMLVYCIRKKCRKEGNTYVFHTGDDTEGTVVDEDDEELEEVKKKFNTSSSSDYTTSSSLSSSS